MHNRSIIRNIFAASLFGLIGTASASTVDISLQQNGNDQLEVKLRPGAAFDGMVSSLVFTVRWDAASEVHLGAIQQAEPAADYIPVSRSGEEQDDGAYRYQIFVGFGITPLQWIPSDWVAGQEYTVMTIPVTGPAQFSLVNDPWTNVNNADYYVALGGIDATGTFYGDVATHIRADAGDENGMRITPNPTKGRSVLHLGHVDERGVRLELHNAQGQLVWSLVRSNTAGELEVPLDLSEMEKGIYLLSVHRGRTVETRSIVKQ